MERETSMPSHFNNHAQHLMRQIGGQINGWMGDFLQDVTSGKLRLICLKSHLSLVFECCLTIGSIQTEKEEFLSNVSTMGPLPIGISIALVLYIWMSTTVQLFSINRSTQHFQYITKEGSFFLNVFLVGEHHLSPTHL